MPDVSRTARPILSYHQQSCDVRGGDDRGDSAGASAIQSMQFWMRPDRGRLASGLSRWMAALQRRRAKVSCRAHARGKDPPQNDRHLPYAVKLCFHFPRAFC